MIPHDLTPIKQVQVKPSPHKTGQLGSRHGIYIQYIVLRRIECKHMYIYILYKYIKSIHLHTYCSCVSKVDLPCISPPCHHPIIWEKIHATNQPPQLLLDRLGVLPVCDFRYSRKMCSLTHTQMRRMNGFFYLHECLYIFFLMVDVGKYSIH